MVADVQSTRKTLAELNISENTDPRIKQLYDELSKSVAQHEELSTNYQSQLRENATAMKDKEQSTANKMLGGLSIGATGIGGMQLMSGLAEKSSDEAAVRDMDAYNATFMCKVGDIGPQVGYGQNYQLTGYSAEFLSLAQQYRDLAAETKITKEALGLAPGIEAEEILDTASLYFYDQITDRPDVFDTAAERLETGDAADKIKTGAIVAGVGVVGGVAGNLIINKDAPREQSAQIKNKYEAESKKIESDLNKKEQQLLTIIAENEANVKKYNELLNQHREKIKNPCQGAGCAILCQKLFEDYKQYIASLSEITDNTQNVDVTTVEATLNEKLKAWTDCKEAEEARLAKQEQDKKDCLSDNTKQWIDGKCTDKAVVSRTTATTPVVVPVNNNESNLCTQSGGEWNDIGKNCDCDPKNDGLKYYDEDSKTCVNFVEESQTVDELQCPADNPRMKSLNANNRVGDFCSYGNVTNGKVFKYKAGSKRNGKDVSGTCSCTANACKAGYHVSGGNCVEDVMDANGICLKWEFDATKEKIDITPATKGAKCSEFCAKKATEKKCTDSKKHMTIQSKNMCVCNMNAQDQADVAQQQAARDKQQDAIDKAKIAALKYYEVCGDGKGKSGGKEYCVDDFFNWINVGMLQATGLAKEYALVKYGQVVECSSSYRSSWNDDYVKCASTDGKNFYEFKFDDVTESIDNTIQGDVQAGVCKIHGSNYTKAGCTGGGTNVSSQMICWSASCAADTGKCSKIDKSLQRFGYNSSFGDGKCNILFNTVRDEESLRTAFGIQNKAFCHGIQVRGSAEITKYLEEYIRSNATASISSVKCDASYKTYTGTGCGVNGFTNLKDDILTCYANGQPIDFVFDDLSENWNSYDKGGRQGMSCIVSGGTYSGKQCIGLSEQQCVNLAQANLKDCTGCKAAKWDSESQSCILPSSSQATNLEKGVRIGTIVAGVAAGAVLTIASGGTATPVLVLVLIEGTGGAIEIASELKMAAVAQEFLTNSNRCKSATCAESMVKENLQRMSNLASRFTDAEINAIDSEMARLINLLPADSQIYKKTLAENSLGFFDSNSWEPEQVWSAIGIGLQLTGLVTAIGRTAVNKLGRATDAFKNGLTRSAAQADSATGLRALPEGPSPRGGGNGGSAGRTPPPGGSGATGGADNARGTGTGSGSSSGGSGNTGPSGGSGGGAAGSTANASTSGRVIVNIDELRAGKGVSGNIEDLTKRYDEFRIDRTNMTGAEVREATATASKNGFDWDADGGMNHIRFTKKPVSQSSTAAGAGTARQTNNATASASASSSNNSNIISRQGNYNVHSDGRITTNQVSDIRRQADEIEELLGDKAVLNASTIEEIDEIAEIRRAAVENYAHLADPEVLQNYAKMSRNNYIDIIVNDPELSRLAMRFNELSDTQKVNFAQRLSDTFNSKIGCEKGVCNVGAMNEASHYTNKTINLKPDDMRTLDDFMNTLSHENNHLIDDLAPGRGGLDYDAARIGRATNVNGEEYYDLYRKNLTEQASHTVGEVVGNGFEQELRNTLRQKATAQKAADDAAKLRTQQEAAARKLADEQAAAARKLAEEQAKAQKLQNMRRNTGLNDLNLVPGAQNSAGVDQYRLLVQLEEEADDIVFDLTNRGFHAGKIKTTSNGQPRFYVAVVDDASDYAKLQSYVQPPKIIAVEAVEDFVIYVDDVADLRRTASSSFERYLDDFKKTGKSVALPKQRLSDDEWRLISDDLAKDNVRLYDDGSGYMQFAKVNNESAFAAEHVDDLHGLGKNIPTEEMIIDGRRVVYAKNSKYFDYIHGNLDLDTPLTKIGSQDVRLVDIPGANGKVGQIGGRPIVVVQVGDKKIPFYVSTGSAGKLEVPTGKWEVIFGIGEQTDDVGRWAGAGWFNKGNLDDIVSHYNSSELKKIADALDSRLGDLRELEDVANTATRAQQGGIGNVGYSKALPNLNNEKSVKFINQSFEVPPSTSNRAPMQEGYNRADIKLYLEQLSNPQGNFQDKIRKLNDYKDMFKNW